MSSLYTRQSGWVQHGRLSRQLCCAAIASCISNAVAKPSGFHAHVVLYELARVIDAVLLPSTAASHHVLHLRVSGVLRGCNRTPTHPGIQTMSGAFGGGFTPSMHLT